jgi:hypothetical protein
MSWACSSFACGNSPKGASDWRTSAARALLEWSAILYSKGDIQVKLREKVALTILFVGIHSLTTGSALAQTRGGAVTIRYTTFSPFIALLAGILILIAPRLLNYIVAIYLILIGLIGIFGV